MKFTGNVYVQILNAIISQYNCFQKYVDDLTYSTSWWNSACFTMARGTRLRSWLKYYATIRKVAGSIPDEVIGIFNWRNPSNRTMAQGSTQPPTEISTRNLPGDKGRREPIV
jgi:hypothetical protein